MIKKGRSKRPFVGILYGEPGVGKSFFASNAPTPLFHCLEDGVRKLDCAKWVYEEGVVDRLRPNSFEEFKAAFESSVKDPGGCETLVLDGLGTLDKLLQEDLLRRNPGWKTIAQGAGGYGNGEAAVLQEWRAFYALIERAVQKGLNVLMLGHSKLSEFKNPEGAIYNYHSLDVQDHKRGNVAGFLREQADFVGFARYEPLLREEGKRTVAVGVQGTRILCLQNTNAFIAKFRAEHMGVPAQIPLSWPEFTKLLNARPEVTEEQVRAEITALLPKLPTEKQAATAKWLASNLSIDDLVIGLDRVRGVAMLSTQ
jgi:hypothetical protein